MSDARSTEQEWDAMLATRMILDYVRYTQWASTALLDACAALSQEELHHDLHTAYPSIWATLVHIYQADAVWLSRFRGEKVMSLAAFEPGSSLEELRGRWSATLQDLVDFAESRTDAHWEETLHYVNTRGAAFSQPLWQAVLHTVNHATLHRGQILAMFRQIGRVPVSVDLINYYRRG